jgi:hypothetical protein
MSNLGEGHPIMGLIGLGAWAGIIGTSFAAGATPSGVIISRNEIYDENDAIVQEGRRREKTYEKVTRSIGDFLSRSVRNGHISIKIPTHVKEVYINCKIERA